MTPSGNSTLYGVTFANGAFVAVGASGTILTSTDGASWTDSASVTSAQLSGVVSGNNTFVAVGYTGTILQSNVLLTAKDMINNGANFTNSTSVTLTLACTDIGSGCAEMQFSNDGAAWTSPEAFAANRAWTLTAGDGLKTVYVMFKDNAGNWSGAYNDTITLDSTYVPLSVDPVTTPTGTNTQTISGTILAGSSVVVSGPTISAGVVTYPSATTWQSTVSLASEGTNTVTVSATDLTGNITTIVRAIVLDTTAPITSASPSAGTYSSAQTVTLTSNEPAMIYYTIDGSTPTYPASGTTTASTSPAIVSIPTTTTLKFFARDLAGNIETPVQSAAYIITTVPPSLSITASAGPNGTITPSGTLSVPYGSNASFTIAPNTGYRIQDVLVDGVSVGTHYSYTFTNVTTDHTISATFAVEVAPAFSSVAPPSNSFINTANIGYALNEDVVSGSVTFTRTGGAADSYSPQTYPLTGALLQTGNHSIDTALPLADGAIYTVTFLASDGTSTGSLSSTNVTFDTTAASITIISPLSNTYVNTATVSYTLSEAVTGRTDRLHQDRRG